ncbi:MAG: efflux RND transporter periplasmic adaptor subunit [Planctomycetota bacterium]
MRFSLGAVTVVSCLLLAASGRGAADGFDSGRPFTGLVRPSALLELGIPVDGRVVAVLVERGDRVSAGDLIARLDIGVEQANLDVSQLRAESEVLERMARVQLDRADDRLEKLRPLIAKGAITGDEFEEAKTQREVAYLEWARAVEDRQVAALEADRARAIVDRRQLISSVDGVVIEKHLSVGELVKSSDGSLVVTVAVLDPLEVELILPASEFRTVRPGQSVRVTVPGYDEAGAIGSVSFVDRVIDAGSDTFTALITLPNPEHRIPAGLECQVEFQEEQR